MIDAGDKDAIDMLRELARLVETPSLTGKAVLARALMHLRGLPLHFSGWSTLPFKPGNIEEQPDTEYKGRKAGWTNMISGRD